MYACIDGIGAGFFERVCPPSNATAHLHDPPPPPLDSRIASHVARAWPQRPTPRESRRHYPRGIPARNMLAAPSAGSPKTARYGAVAGPVVVKLSSNRT